MASPPVGGGKIRTRRYHINAKPYSKNQPQGILGRVTDSVKSIVPVWLQKYFHKGEDSCPNVSESRLLTESQSANQEIQNHVYVDEPPPLTEGRVTAEPVIRHVDEQSTRRTSLQFPDVLTRPSLHRSNLNFSMLDSSTLHCQPSTSSAIPFGSSGFSLVKEIRDSASQHDDDNISTTSGFSSRASDKDVSISKSVTGPPLWSPEPDRSHSFTQQNSTSLRKPSFNLSAFGSLSPSLANTSQLKSSQLGDSPFYPGKTAYGGAASIRQSKVRTTPYQAPLRRQMKAKQSNTQSYGVTSSTARRILQSLDKMSSPLADARRIPSAASSPLSAPDRNFMDGTEFQLKKKVDSHPPVHKLLTPKPVCVSVNRSMYIKPSLPSLPAAQMNKISRRTEENSVPRKKNHTSEQMPEDSAQRFSYPKSSTPAANGLTAGGGGGKMRRERSAHYTKCVQDEEGEDIPALPNISLPISSSALPSFSFASLAQTTALPSTTVTKPVINMVLPTNKFNSSPVFTFSSPIVKSREKSTPPLGSPIGFTFSIPGVKSADLSTPTNKTISVTISPAKDGAFTCTNSNNDEQYDGPFKPAKTLKSGSVLDILKSPAFASTSTSATPSVSPLINSSTVAKSEISTTNVVGASFGTMYKPDATLWQCDTCLVQNKETDSKCVACSSAKASTVDTVKQTVTSTPSSITKSLPTATSGFGDKFKPVTGSWECDTCLVQNKPESTKCVACETPKPGTGVKPALTLPPHTSTAAITASAGSFPPTTALLGFGDKFKRPPGSWDCTVCLVQNKAEDSKCVSCLSQKPGEPAPVTSSTVFSVPTSFGPSVGFGDKFKKPEGSWDCETCLVQNKADSIKCAACESAKPGTKAEPKGFGTLVASSNTTVPSFKFGIQSSAELSTSESVGGFKFGNQGGFKFGVTSSDSGASSTTTGGFSLSKIGERSFGIPSTNSKSNESKKDSTQSNSGFTFGLASGSNNPLSAAPHFNTSGLGQQEKELKSTPGSFTFGVGSATVSSSESSGVFNLKKAEEKADSAASPFTFSQPSEKKNEAPTTLGGFTFGKVEQLKEPVTIAPFVVGRTGDKVDSVSSSSVPLIFGKQSENEPPKPSLSFGKTDQTKDDPTRPTFSFGLTKPAETKDPQPSAKQCLTFGGSTSTSDQGAAKPSFSFQSVGSSSTVASSSSVASSSGFGNSTSASNPPAATFIFGQASSTTGSSTFGSTNDAKVPHSFIFSSQETKTATTSSSTGTTAAAAPFVFGPAGSSTNTVTPNFSFGTTNTSSSTGTTTTPFMFGSGSSAAVAPSFGTTLTNPPAFGPLSSATGFSTGPQPPVAFGSGASSNPTSLFGQQASQPPTFGSGTATSNAGPTFQFGANSGFNFSSSNSSGVFTFGTNTGGPTNQPQTQPQPPTQSGFGFNPPAASFTLGTNGKSVTNRKIKTAVRRRK